MKIMKKLAAVLLALFLICPCFVNVALAADGVAFFTDLETKVGDEFTITGTVVAKNSVVGDATIELTYDTEYMRFVSGDSGVEDSNGTISFTGSGDGSSDRLTFDMTFQALQEGDTQMDQTVAEVTTYYGDTVNCTMGYSAISIGEGDPSKIQQPEDTTSGATGDSLTVGDKEYAISEVFSEAEIPVGFTAADVTYNGNTYKGISQVVAGVNAVFATDSDGVGKFFIINETKNELYPLEEFVISEAYSIFILDGSEEVKMPEKYEPADVDINGRDFPVWIEPDRDGFYIFYAMNSDGVKSLYLYDSEERTYQRMETPKTVETEVQEVSELDKAMAMVEDYLIWFMVGAGCAVFVLLIIVIVLAVKLRHRNLELDDLYDEYGIDLEEGADKVNAQTDLNFSDDKDYFEVSEDFFDDDFDKSNDDYTEDQYEDDDYDNSEYEYEDDEYDEAEYEYEEDEYDETEYEYEDDEYEFEDEEKDYYEEDDLADLRRDFGVGTVSSGSSNYDSFYDEDDFAEDDYLEESSKAKLRKDDTFEMNFIDLE